MWAGVLLVNPADRVLLARRSTKVSSPKLWAIPGGGVEPGEDPAVAALREFHEEMGLRVALPYDAPPVLVTGDRIVLVVRVAEALTPTLNFENDAWGWYERSELPAPMHPAALRVLRSWWD